MNNRIGKIKYLNKISKDDKLDVPNPFRLNYDYGEDGYNFLDKIKELNKRRKKKDGGKKKSRHDHLGALLKRSQKIDVVPGSNTLNEADRETLRENEYPNPVYKGYSEEYSRKFTRELNINCPQIRGDASSIHGEGLVEWQTVAIQILPRRSIYIPVTITGEGVLDIYIDEPLVVGGESLQKATRDVIDVKVEGGLRVKTSSKSRTYGYSEGLDHLRDRYISIGREKEGDTGPIKTGLSIQNLEYPNEDGSGDEIRVVIGGTCFPKDCAGRDCAEWVVTDPTPYQKSEALVSKDSPEGSQAETNLPIEYHEPNYYPGEMPAHQDGAEGHPKKWKGRMIAPYDEDYPGDAVDEIIPNNMLGGLV